MDQISQHIVCKLFIILIFFLMKIKMLGSSGTYYYLYQFTLVNVKYTEPTQLTGHLICYLSPHVSKGLRLMRVMIYAPQLVQKIYVIFTLQVLILLIMTLIWRRPKFKNRFNVLLLNFVMQFLSLSQLNYIEFLCYSLFERY